MRPERSIIRESSLALIGIPRNLINNSIKDFIAESGEEKEVKEFVSEYIDELDIHFKHGRGIFFCGSNGVGKTMLSCIILKEAYRKRYTCKRLTFSKYMSLYTESWSDDNDFDNIKTTEFLVLEELGKEVENKLSASVLEELLRYRDEHMLSTVICSNLGIKQVELKYGSSVVSLIKGSLYPVKIVDKDRRVSK